MKGLIQGLYIEAQVCDIEETMIKLFLEGVMEKRKSSSERKYIPIELDSWIDAQYEKRIYRQYKNKHYHWQSVNFLGLTINLIIHFSFRSLLCEIVYTLTQVTIKESSIWFNHTSSFNISDMDCLIFP